MKVVEVVKPRQMRTMAARVKRILSRFPWPFTTFSKGGKGNSRAATKPMAKGSRNWAMEMESLVKMLAMVPFSLKISMQEGVMLVSRKEFAMPLMTAST